MVADNLVLSKIITVGWLLVWMTGEGIGSTLESLGSKIVMHDSPSQTLQGSAFNLVQAMRVKNGNKGVAISDNNEMAQFSKEEMVLLDGQGNCQAFQLNNSIISFLHW